MSTDAWIRFRLGSSSNDVWEQFRAGDELPQDCTHALLVVHMGRKFRLEDGLSNLSNSLVSAQLGSGEHESLSET